LIIKDDYIYAGTLGASVWRRSLSEIISVNNISSKIPEKYFLYQNYPNPFNPRTNIKYQITKEQMVILNIYDVLGRKVETIINQSQKPGVYEISFDGGKLSSGIYFYSLFAGGKRIDTKKMLIIK